MRIAVTHGTVAVQKHLSDKYEWWPVVRILIGDDCDDFTGEHYSTQEQARVAAHAVACALSGLELPLETENGPVQAWTFDPTLRKAVA